MSQEFTKLPNLKRSTDGKPLARQKSVDAIADFINSMAPTLGHGQGDDDDVPFDKVLVKLTSAVNASTSVGRYNGRMSDMAVDLEATGNLIEANLGTFATADDTIVWLLSDTGQSTNSISTFSPAPMVYGWMIGVNAAGKRIVVVPRGGGSTLPAPSALYQVLMCTSFTDSTTYTLAFGYVRGVPAGA